tara:strand:- start:4504 stop:4758 length:255 start_codon:yes stop_codon:yes gene_type:complete
MKLLKKVNKLNYLTFITNLLIGIGLVWYGISDSIILCVLGIVYSISTLSKMYKDKLLNDYNNKVVDLVNPLTRYELDDEDEYDV